ncbi:hypothetical protein CsSME_00034028 [Camellia sinensis var. sinensis]
MGKKGKKKARSGHKERQERRVSTASQRSVGEESIPTTEAVNDGLSVVKERKVCAHLDKGIDLVKVSSRIGSIEGVRCEDCREGVVGRRAGKGRGKHGKKKGGGSVDTKSENKAIWVCLECGHFSCGGIGLPTTSQSHAVWHARQNRHPLAIQFENLQLCWCFPCNMLIPIEKLEENGEHKDLLSDIVKLIKGRSSQRASADVEDVRFGSDSVTSELKSENTAQTNFDGKSGYVVRGLVNLGNTCFFNSIMQNLLAIDKLREHFLDLDESVGPLTVSLKKVFAETSQEAGLRNVINPRSLFGCICSKAPQFRGYQQHDSHELLRCLLDGLCTEELSARKQNTWENGISKNLGPTFVDTIFGGQLSSTVSCLECGHSSTVFEPFLDLSLPVPTKKPLSKRAQSVSRAKKPKLPPKRSARIRPKVNNKGADFVESESVPILTAGGASSCLVGSSLPLSDEAGDALANPTLPESIGLSAVAEKGSSVLLNPLTTEEFEKKPFLKNVTNKEEDSLGNLTWLDFLEPDPVTDGHDTASKANDTAVIHDSGKKVAVQNDASLQDGIESSKKVHSLCMVETSGSSSNWDYSEPAMLLDEHDMASKVNNASETQDYRGKDAAENGVFLQNISGPSAQVCTLYMEPNLEVNSVGNSFENELPLQVHGSEILLLPYKNETSTSVEILGGEGEASLSAVGCEPDVLDFDGFGDLFNEPDIAAGPNAEPLSSNNNYQADEIAETASLVGNISETDPDEVDDSDSPVSIESCLAYFIKPELLSNEHAWHCENCSKVMQEQRMQSRKKKQKAPPKIQISGLEDRIQSNPSSSTNDCPCPGEVRSLSNGDIRKDVPSTSDERLVSDDGKIDVNKSEEGNDEINDAVAELSQSSSSYKTCSQATISGEGSDSCSVNEPSKAGCDADELQQRKLQLLPEGSDSEGSDNEEMNSYSVKVKRDATKRILINKAPTILTIHLKRFSQDARGRLSKLNGHVNFRETIDLGPYMGIRCTKKMDECKFRLLGVVEHLGTMRGGHYVAYVRGKGNNRKAENENEEDVWYHASDAYVREATLEEVLRCEAYILFYEKM